MKVVLAILVALTFGGCVTDGIYNAGKPLYKATKKGVEIIPMPNETREYLKTVDGVATTYDEARTLFREEFESGKSDANTSKASEE